MNYWLMKSEPGSFSIDDLYHRPLQTEQWDGVRNYQARNLMRDQMKQGDLAFFYHSNITPPGIVGTVQIVRESYPDFTCLDPESHYFDPRSTSTHPRWFMVDVQFQEKFSRIITLEELRLYPELANMPLLRKGSRLSIMPVTVEEWQLIDSIRRRTGY